MIFCSFGFLSLSVMTDIDGVDPGERWHSLSAIAGECIALPRTFHKCPL